MTKSEKLTLLDTADIILDLTVVLNFARWRLDLFFLMIYVKGLKKNMSVNCQLP